jgi:hypothetical protein
VISQTRILFRDYSQRGVAATKKHVRSYISQFEKARVDDRRARGVLDDVADQPADRTRVDQNLEDESFWPATIEDRRERGGERAGVTTQVNPASYLRLLDWSARLSRPGKFRMSPEVAGLAR